MVRARRRGFGVDIDPGPWTMTGQETLVGRASRASCPAAATAPLSSLPGRETSHTDSRRSVWSTPAQPRSSASFLSIGVDRMTQDHPCAAA